MFSIAKTDLMVSTPSDSLKGLGLGGSTSRACMVADVLSWSVQRGIPLQESLRSLPFYRRLDLPLFGLLVGLGWMLGPLAFMTPLPWLIDVSWSYRVRRLISGLDRGEKLGRILRRSFPREFPEFYLIGVEKAEAENHLETALPVLAHQLNYPCTVAKERTMELFFVLERLLSAAAVLMFIATAIAPRFHMIFQELCESNTVPPFARLSAVLGPLALVAVIVILFLLLLPGLGRFGEFVILRLPIIGGEVRRFALGDLARSMAAFLRQGDNILTAAEWSMKASRSRWLKKRLERCIGLIRKGVRWEQAWAEMELGRPLDQWVISNAAMREDPASGFELLAEWLQQETEQSTRRLERWVDPVCTLATAIIVGTIAYYAFSTLIGVMYSLM